MKTVLFFRHGKSDWDADFDHDHNRPLAKRGRKAAKAMGVLLADLDQLPDRILCSSAVRARNTLHLASEAGGWDVPVETTEALYHAASTDLLAFLRREAETTDVLMLVGHEPTWSDTISRLIGGGHLKYPTAAVARVDLHISSWAKADFGTGTLIYLFPSRLFS